MTVFKIFLVVVCAVIFLVQLDVVRCTIHDKERMEAARKGFSCFVREWRRSKNSRNFSSASSSTDPWAASSSEPQFGPLNCSSLISLEEFYQIQHDLLYASRNDQCSKTDFFALQLGVLNCDKAFKKFLRIPQEFRGSCARAVRAYCHQWTLAEGGKKRCSFFVRTSPEGAKKEEGQWQPLVDCANGLEKYPLLPIAQPMHTQGSTSYGRGERKIEVIVLDD